MPGYSGDYGATKFTSQIMGAFEQMRKEEAYNDQLIQKALATGNMTEEEYMKYRKAGHGKKKDIAGGLAARFADEYAEDRRLQNLQAQTAIDMHKANILSGQQDYALKLRQFNQQLAERQYEIPEEAKQQARWTGHELIPLGPGKAPVLAEYPKSTAIGAPITEIPQVTETSVVDAMGVKKTFEKKKNLPIAVTRIPGTDKFHVTDLPTAADTEAPTKAPEIFKGPEGEKFFYERDPKTGKINWSALAPPDPMTAFYAKAAGLDTPEVVPPPAEAAPTPAGVPSGIPAAAAAMFGGGQSREAQRPQVDWAQIMSLLGLGGAGAGAAAAPVAPVAPARQMPSPPAVGTVRNGYRYKGGDPAKAESWEKI